MQIKTKRDTTAWAPEWDFKKKKRLVISNVGELIAQLKLSYITPGVEFGTTTFENVWQ